MNDTFMLSKKTYTLVFLVTGFPPDVSGVSHFNWERVHWLAKQGMYRVIVFAPDWQNAANSLGKDSPLPDNLIIELYPSKPWAPYKFTYVPTLAAISFINKKIVDYQPDLFIITDVERFFLLSGWRLPGIKYARLNNIPYVAEYHTDLYNFSAAYPGWQWLRSLVKNLKLSNYLYKQVDLVICATDSASISCREMGLTNIYKLSFLGIDISLYNPDRRDRQNLLFILSKEEKDNKVILFLGRLAFEKRVDLLITAFLELEQRFKNCSLIIAGDGPEDIVKQLKDLAQQSKNIHFTGFLLGDNKANVMASCDVFCSPCPYETFGRTTVEAMASGIPVVTVNSGAVAEYITNGVNGYLFSHNDIKSLTDILEKALLSDNEKITQKALKDAQLFSNDKSLSNLANLYNQLIEKSAKYD